MKRTLVVFLAVVFGLFLASANQLTAAPVPAGTGLLRIKHSPALGINVTLAVRIDGARAGVFSKGHVYERVLSQGRHSVSLTGSTGMSDSVPTHLDVRPGQTYSFIVKTTPARLLLIPVSRIE